MIDGGEMAPPEDVAEKERATATAEEVDSSPRAPDGGTRHSHLSRSRDS